MERESGEGLFVSLKRSRSSSDEEGDEARRLATIMMGRRVFLDEDSKALLPYLYSDLEKVSPSAAKACDILNEEYVIWLNKTFHVINIQNKVEFLKGDSSDGKVGIKLLPSSSLPGANQQDNYNNDNGSVEYWVDGSPSASGLSNIAISQRFAEIAKYISDQAQLLDMSSCFNPDNLRLLFNDLKLREDALRLTISDVTAAYTTTTFILWCRAVSSGPRGGYGGRFDDDEGCVMNYYLNIQDYDNYRWSRQNNKLGLGISEKGEITSVMMNGARVNREEVMGDLYSPRGKWQKRLKGLLLAWIQENGIRLLEYTLTVHPLALKICPEAVLAKYVHYDLPHDVDRIVFMKEESVRQNQVGSDWGGLTKHFVTELCQNLFDGATSRMIQMDESGLPYLKTSSDADLAVARNVGKLLSYVYFRVGPVLTTGRVMSDNFLAMMRHLSDDFELSKLALGGSPMYQPFFEIQPFFDILGEDDGISPRRSVERYEELRKHCVEMVSYSSSPFTGSSDQELKEHILEFLKEMRRPYVEMAKAALSGTSEAFKARLRGEGEDLRAMNNKLQGNLLDKDDVIGRIDCSDVRHNAAVMEKVGFLKAYIKERADKDWLELLLLCVTGQRNLFAGSKIVIHSIGGVLCVAHTCFNTLDIPSTHLTPPLDIADPAERFIKNLEITMAQARTFSLA